jgi:calcineurin-like phosphoesterase family protein
MSIRWWVADLHLGHGNIAKYCNRPSLRKEDLDEHGNWVSSEVAFWAAERMDNLLIKNLNMRIKKDDRVIHVGDFLNKGSVKGIPGLNNKSEYYLDLLNGMWTLTEGNHDCNNGVKPICKHMFTEISKLPVFVSHYPIENLEKFDPDLIKYVVNNTAFQICGHVHNSWEYKYYIYDKGKYLMYNVGIDIQNYNPISDAEIFCAYTRIIKENK